jgi:hypothetical protein
MASSALQATSGDAAMVLSALAKREDGRTSSSALNLRAFSAAPSQDAHNSIEA